MDAEEGEEHIFEQEHNDDGLFFMTFDDFTREFDDLSICIDFPHEYSGRRFAWAWDKTNSGGVPFNNLPQEFESFKLNPQYKVSIKRKDANAKTDLFVSLAQNDGRMMASTNNKFPYRTHIRESMMFIFKLNPGMKKLAEFDMDLFVDQTPLITYRELVLNKQLENGDYIVIPATSSAGLYGEFFMAFYSNAHNNEIEITEVQTGKKGEVIEEEEEQTAQKFSDSFKKVAHYLVSQTAYVSIN